MRSANHRDKHTDTDIDMDIGKDTLADATRRQRLLPKPTASKISVKSMTNQDQMDRNVRRM